MSQSYAFSSLQVLATVEKDKQFNCSKNVRLWRLGRAKLPIFLSSISAATIYSVIISSNSSISNLSLHTTHVNPQKLMSSYSTHEVPHLVKQQAQQEDTETDHTLLVLSFNVTVNKDWGDTPALAWFDRIKSGEQNRGEIPLAQNLSNLIRLVILYKYGGVHLDTDFITLKDFSGLRNSIEAQSIDATGSWTRLNNHYKNFHFWRLIF